MRIYFFNSFLARKQGFSLSGYFCWLVHFGLHLLEKKSFLKKWMAVCLFAAEKREAQKKKVTKIRLFLCFFWKMTKFWLTLKLSKFVAFFHRNAQTSPQHSFKHISNNFGLKWAYPDTILVFLQHLWKKKLFFEKNWNFFLKGYTVVFEKKIFFFGKICHFMKRKKTFWPLLSSWSYLPSLLQKW